jgi:hypothetical protein
VFEDFDRDSFDGWFVTGDAFGDRPSRAGDLRLELGNGSARLVSVRPGCAHSGLVSDRLCGVLRSRAFTLESRYIHWRVAGRGGRINVVIDGFEKIRDPIYGGLTRKVDVGDEPRWITQDLGMWLGHSAYLEICDGGTVDFGGALSIAENGGGFIAVDEIQMSNRPSPSITRQSNRDNPVAIDLNELIAILKKPGRDPLAADRLTAKIDEARTIEARLPDSTFALATADGTGENERVHIRGSHKNLGEFVPRRFLEVLRGLESSTQNEGSGRLELARKMVDAAANPLLARVLVNRLWKHHFGEGIVKTTDDFGAMGRTPTHPELLDWLAAEFVGHGWSIKQMHRLLVTSSTYRMVSVPHPGAEALDPTNQYLHRMNVRRLEAEAIRDSLLAVAGDLSASMYGPSVPVHLTSFMDGRGRPGRSGPLDGNGRRSIYQGVRRNFLNPLFLAFDAPAPFSTMGRRNVSNVPAQALALLNYPLVVDQARLWAQRLLASSCESDREKLDELYATAFARPPTEQETTACLLFLATQKRERNGAPASDRGRDLSAWADLCHVLFNFKEFIFVN